MSNLMVILFVLDINKFLWMVRIGGSTEKGRHINEMDYYTPQGEFRVDREGSPVLLNCLMYKMCYYRFGAVYTESGKCFGERKTFLPYMPFFFWRECCYSCVHVMKFNGSCIHLLLGVGGGVK